MTCFLGCTDMCAIHLLTLVHSYRRLIVAQLQSFRQNLESKVAIKENENRTILQKMQHAEQDLQVPLLQGRNIYANIIFKGMRFHRQRN